MVNNYHLHTCKVIACHYSHQAHIDNYVNKSNWCGRGFFFALQQNKSMLLFTQFHSHFNLSMRQPFWRCWPKQMISGNFSCTCDIMTFCWKRIKMNLLRQGGKCHLVNQKVLETLESCSHSLIIREYHWTALKKQQHRRDINIVFGSSDN